MDVYLVTSWADYEGEEPAGIFAETDLAVAYVRQQPRMADVEPRVNEDGGWWYQGKLKDGSPVGGGYLIRKMPVQGYTAPGTGRVTGSATVIHTAGGTVVLGGGGGAVGGTVPLGGGGGGGGGAVWSEVHDHPIDRVCRDGCPSYRGGRGDH
jgi:hypothetical protein